MLALPFVTEGTGFKGVIYATEPTLQIGRFFMEELVEYIEQTPRAKLAKHWKEMIHILPPPLADALKPKSWKHIYSIQAVNSALSNIQLVGYDQKLVSLNHFLGSLFIIAPKIQKFKELIFLYFLRAGLCIEYFFVFAFFRIYMER